MFFEFSIGISKAMRLPKGTIATVEQRIAETETALGITRETYNGELRWNHCPLVKATVTDGVYCSTVENHNRTVRWFHSILEDAHKKWITKDFDKLTPSKAKTFWFALSQLNVPVERWNDDYYQARMDALYSAFRGEETEGMSFDAKPLDTKQADAVIGMLSGWLDHADIRLSVVRGDDHLSRSDDYMWCS